MRPLLLALVLPLLAFAAAPARAISPQAGLCRAAVAGAEQALRIPDALLSAISKVESGRADADTGTMQAWPWTINAEGVGHFYESKAEAIAAAQAMQARGIRSMDVGCLQVNLSYHPNAFASLDQAFDPQANALYAARFLTELFQQQGSWPHAAAAYHSQSPGLGADYQRKVLDVWATPDRPRTGSGGGTRLAQSGSNQSGSGQGGADAAMSGLGARVPAPGGGGMVPLGGGAHIIRMAGAAGVIGTGRGLDAYRVTPIAMASRPMRIN